MTKLTWKINAALTRRELTKDIALYNNVDATKG
jgi:hypothetical protein